MRRAAVLAVLASAAMLAANAAGPDAAAPAGHAAYAAAVDKIGRALSDEDFGTLEAMHRQFASTGARSSDGTWMMQGFEIAFEAYFESAPPARLEKLFRDWRAHDTASILRPIAEGYALQQRALRAKGTSCHPVTLAAARKAYDHLLQRASAVLREGEARGTDSPLWYSAAILVAGSRGEADASLDALLAKAVERFPAYEPAYAARLVFLLPPWNDDFDRLDAFIRRATQESSAIEGRGMYAWLYEEVARRDGCDYRLEDTRVSWRDMKAAFEDMVARHPDAWNRNAFATFACRARDAETTRRLLEALGKEAKLGTYSSGISNESCYRLIQPPERPAKIREAALRP